MTENDLRDMREDFTNNIKPKYDPGAADKSDCDNEESHSEDDEEVEEEEEEQEGDEFYCKLSGLADDLEKGIQRGKIHIKSKDLEDIFIPTFTRIFL